MRVALALLVVTAVIACGKTSPQVSASNAPPAVSPKSEGQSTLYDQLHSGLFQADAAVKKLADAVDLAGEIEGKSKGDLAASIKNEMIPTLDDAGSTLASLTGDELPSAEDVAKQDATFQKRRADLIQKVNDILKDVREQEGSASDMALNQPPAIGDSAKRLDALLSEIIDDLLGALDGLGGKEEGAQNEPDTADTNQKPPPGYGR